MAGYFDYVGRVFTEKGSWYKILLLTVLQGITILFNPNGMVNGGVLNIPGIILYFLAVLLIYGFCIQVYHSFMNNKKQLLPDIDFFDMVAKSFRMVPFGLCWGVYFAIFGIFMALSMPSIMRMFSSKIVFGVMMALMIIVVVIFLIIWTVLMVLHAKSFSYKYVLNPLTPFRLLPRVFGPLFLLILLYILIALILYGLLFGGAILLGVSGVEGMATSTTVAFGILLVIFGYLNNACSLAYNLRLVDIVKTRLADTEFLDDDDYVPGQEEEPVQDETVDY